MSKTTQRIADIIGVPNYGATSDGHRMTLPEQITQLEEAIVRIADERDSARASARAVRLDSKTVEQRAIEIAAKAGVEPVSADTFRGTFKDGKVLQVQTSLTGLAAVEARYRASGAYGDGGKSE